jgi:hypothetical protein
MPDGERRLIKTMRQAKRERRLKRRGCHLEKAHGVSLSAFRERFILFFVAVLD